MVKKKQNNCGMIFYASPSNRHKNKDMTALKKKVNVAVYGSLRQGLGNYSRLQMEEEEYVGRYETDPIYNLHDIGGYPGLTKDGSTSVVMEVYKVDAAKLRRLDVLEGYGGPDAEHNHYNREKIDTPFGIAFTYFYNYETDQLKLVASGDWTDYYNLKRVKTFAL